ncbi:MAG: DDE-type integrase/transposase/recombinase [Desulfobacteraceae bacterium]|nr:DDE-type integrase/transposase/recombinase [Desulfobacteraceae bacterium]
MVREEKSNKNMEVATFRFGIISDFVVGLCLGYGEKEKLLKAKVSKKYKIPYSSQTTISRSTIKKWIALYRQAGNRIEGLYPSKRKDIGKYRSLDTTIQMAIKEIKQKQPELTGVAIISELRHKKYLSMEESINLSVLYRYLKKEDISRPKKIIDRRSFEASAPNELWQSDILHGPYIVVKGKKRKTYLIAIMDDHSRLVVHGEFYFSENFNSFKNCFKQALEKRGLPQKIYIDNGSCYRAINLEQITASLGIGIVHTPAYTPQGRGKIERWFRYVRDNFLLINKKNKDINILNEQFADWLESYNNKVHSVTKMTPIARYKKNLKCVRPVPADLINYFRKVEFRRVKKDRTIQLNGTIFEVPIDLIDLKVELKFHQETPDDVEIFYDNRSFGKATLLDRNVNFKVGRNSKVSAEQQNTLIETGKIFS